MVSLSIHPRNWYLVDSRYTKGQKQNTCKPSKKQKAIKK